MFTCLEVDRHDFIRNTELLQHRRDTLSASRLLDAVDLDDHSKVIAGDLLVSGKVGVVWEEDCEVLL